MEQNEIVKELLSIDHRNVAIQLRLLDQEPVIISDTLLFKTVSILNELSLSKDRQWNTTIVTLSAIIWSYRQPHWSGIREFFMVLFSRIGFAPTTAMFDGNFDPSSNRYSGLSSLFHQLSVVTNQARNTVVVGDSSYILTDFQFNVWKKMEGNRVVGISAPTSAGKSFVIALKAIELLKRKNGDLVYVVPTLSLVSQVSLDFRRLLRKHQMSGYDILNTYSGRVNDKNAIYILTQEKAIAAFSQAENPFENLRLIVVDEIQNVERVASEDDQRSKTLYDMIIEFKQNATADHIVFAGPRINNIGKLGSDLIGFKCNQEEVNNSPVGNITYSLLKKQKKIFFKQYSVIQKEPASIEISASVNVPKTGAVYDEDFHRALLLFVRNLGDGAKNIIFSPTPDQAEKTAGYLYENNQGIVGEIKLGTLSKYLQDTVHKSYDLTRLVQNRVVYHHGRLPHHVRRVIERAINDKLIDNVVCTTTLMQGVNLPAQNVIVRNPNLFIKKRTDYSPTLSHYEMANLRGRAGRLMKDFVGRTFVLNEESFAEENTEGSLFADASKDIQSGYGTVYHVHQNDIMADLVQGRPVGFDNKEYGFLLTYLRQMAIRYPDSFVTRLKDVNIDILPEEVDVFKGGLAALSVPAAVCLKNRYWDPIVLDQLYKQRASFSLPIAANEGGIARSIVRAVDRMRQIAPEYASRYFDVQNARGAGPQLLTQTSILAESWLKEKSLTRILNTQYYNQDPSRISDAIERLQGKISYGLPMLLQPIYDIKHPDSSFLRFLETGAFRPVTRKLIERSIPRETAIFLTNSYFSSMSSSELDIESDILPVLRSIAPQLDYWIRVQLEVVL